MISNTVARQPTTRMNVALVQIAYRFGQDMCNIYVMARPTMRRTTLLFGTTAALSVGSK